MVAESLGEEELAAVEKAALVNAARHGGKAEVGAIVGRVLAEHPELRTNAGLVAKEAAAAARRVNALSAEEQGRLVAERYPEEAAPPEKHGRVGLPALPNAVKGKTAFRLPPEPSGYMTVGHAMAFTINYLYKEQYDGELWLRFEDTNPRKVLPQYYDSFRRGVAWLSIEYDHEKNVSDDMDVIYEAGRKLLERGMAYACSCDEAKVKKLRFEGTPCEHRDSSVESNLKVWEELLARSHGEGTYVIRFKGDMVSPNYSLRDTNLFRVISHPHPLTGDRYTLWPTYDLANAVEDEICGITHVLRSSEFRNELQQLIRDALGFRRIEVIQFSRFNFKGTPVSKRLLRPLVEKKVVSGWDDPRMPTVDGLRRRGIIPQAIREFTLQVGYTKTEHEYDWSILLSVNRKLLDPLSKRVFFVPEPVRLQVAGAPRKAVTLPFHPQRDLGARTVEAAGEFYVPSADIRGLKKGAVFRLMDLYNVRLTADWPSPEAEYAGDELVPDSKKLQWVTGSHGEAKVTVPGELFLEGDVYNTDSLKEVAGYAEDSASGLSVGDIVQFPRFGFCRLDSPGRFILAG
ncbi:MAG: glutamate--tRNA ligase [Nitrososphaerota archaeon]|jgi:glutamyl-tRNA synthetase|nr:glutamate--tRNA ligase [Nitrososphaerota archaeon]MDG6955942.1 glutamate--tRNA ligase [Nitrososphaerota archaeon]MDG6957162.1 glutamate--tRNA ligase [Nitrososphaerota archaeon]MDG6959079.1 glutamate--tRNA ligase [Nitrososphaerota archaeon]MDG6968200.1 glutamate--tRNA ligase [Nitrososphaerota archaeon]